VTVPRVNLLSDTQTLPTAAMRGAIATAEVGDEQRGEDPTVNALQARVAELLGQESALFLPSGTMCNAIALMLHVRAGDEVLLHREAHPIVFESGGPAALSGAMIGALDGEGGMFSPETLVAAVWDPTNRYHPRSRLVSVEQTTNLGGGRVWPLEQVRAVLAAAREHGLATHLDGARLMNAVVASGVSASEWASGFDTAWVDFTKGLGAPVGAALAGSRELIAEAWRLKQRIGGAMRQAGIVAAAGLYALDHHVERLAEDHARARRLADGLSQLPGVAIDPTTVDTNIVVFEVADAAAFTSELARAGVGMGPMGPRRVRAVTHLDVDDADIELALEAAELVMAGSGGTRRAR
jgi:threonine aldolase